MKTKNKHPKKQASYRMDLPLPKGKRIRVRVSEKEVTIMLISPQSPGTEFQEMVVPLQDMMVIAQMFEVMWAKIRGVMPLKTCSGMIATNKETKENDRTK
jgi:hypothetical protein